MRSPLFELTLYSGLGVASGIISVVFTNLRKLFTELFDGRQSWAAALPFKNIPFNLRPLLGGIVCGMVAIYFPQTLFVGYTTLDQLLAGKIFLGTALLFQLLSLKIFLTSFSLGCGLVGGVFAPALFFGATLGTMYHDVWLYSISNGLSFLNDHGIVGDAFDSLKTFLSIANAPAYVGAAATLGALFRAPLTSSMLMFELTQNHDIVLPVLVSTGLGGLFAELISQPREQW